MKDKCNLNEFYSDIVTNSFGVPQGPVLGPVLFTFYTIPISKIIKALDFTHHFYADDT
jgi:hypothetical protein